MELTEYFEWDGDGVLTPLGAWPSFDDVPRNKNSVWIFEGRQELEDFVEQASELLERWNA